MKLKFIFSRGFGVHSKSVAYAAFAATVLAGFLAAAMVAGNDVPLVLGGL